MPFAVGDVVWQTLIQVGIGAVVTIVLAVMSQRTKKAVEATAADAALHREVVREDLKEQTVVNADKLEGLAKVAKATHTLVNSAMAQVLQQNAELARWKADHSKDTPEGPANAAAAEVAEQLMRDHEHKQKQVDSQPGSDTQKSGG
jgi:hypothetical protein